MLRRISVSLQKGDWPTCSFPTMQGTVIIHLFCQLKSLLAADGGRPYFNETINYNEHFDWRWEQGRLGFGIFGKCVKTLRLGFVVFGKCLKTLRIQKYCFEYFLFPLTLLKYSIYCFIPCFIAGRFNQEFRAAQFRGTPLPIIWIAEYFIFDGEGIRWGRHYRQAGWYAHIMMWYVC